MNMSFLLWNPFQKGFVRAHKRNGKTVGPYFTKRPPAVVKEKHTRERYHDLDTKSAQKQHQELEDKKGKHQTILDSLKSHYDELKNKGPSKEDSGVPHKTKLSHLKQEIKNQEMHIANLSRKQGLINKRYNIGKKQVENRQQKTSLDKMLSGHSEAQKKTVMDIHNAYANGKTKLKANKVLTGEDKDHIYLETKHDDTGETHHVAIHKDGTIKDPKILHEGKFDPKSLGEKKQLRTITAKKEEVKNPKKQRKIVRTEKTEQEKKRNRSQAMISNKNAYKGGAENKNNLPSKTNIEDIPWKGGVKLSDAEDKAVDEWISEEGNRKITDMLKSGKSNDITKNLENALNKLQPYKGVVYRGIGNLTKEQFEKITNQKEMEIPYVTSASSKMNIAESFLHRKMKKNEENYGVIFKIVSKTGRDLQTYEGEVALLPSSKYRIKNIGKIKPYSYNARLLNGKTSKRKDKKAKVVEIEVEEIESEKKNRFEAMKGNKNFYKGGPKNEK